MCEDCKARRKLAREAFINSKISEALGHVAVGAVEALGLKEKTGLSELSEKPKKTSRTGKQIRR